jgi:hypothetical protein
MENRNQEDAKAKFRGGEADRDLNSRTVSPITSSASSSIVFFTQVGCRTQHSLLVHYGECSLLSVPELVNLSEEVVDTIIVLYQTEGRARTGRRMISLSRQRVHHPCSAELGSSVLQLHLTVRSRRNKFG